MTVKKHIKIISAFITIFILGILTGASLMPVVFHKVEGNPYSIKILSERIYNTNLLKNAGLTPDQQIAVDELSSEYVLKYTAERSIFMAKRKTLYGEFKFDLSQILTPSQYDNFVNKSDAIIKDREIYNKSLEDKWKTDKTKKSDTNLSSNYEKKLKSITFDMPTDNIVPEDLKEISNGASDELDLFNRYMIDRTKYKWGTYTLYHEVTSDKNIISDDIIEP